MIKDYVMIAAFVIATVLATVRAIVSDDRMDWASPAAGLLITGATTAITFVS